jgi:hypothetical protein
MLTDENIVIITGVTKDLIRDLVRRVEPHTSWEKRKVQAMVILVFILLKHTPTWDLAAIFWRVILAQPEASERSLRRWASELLTALLPLIPFDKERRYDYECESIPGVYSIIDCTPLRVRGPKHVYNGKYHTKVLKYQVICDLRGVTIDARPTGSREHDAVAARAGMIPLRDGEWILGDRGYQGVDRVVTPFKRSRGGGPLTADQLRFNKFHGIIRAKIEHVFARVRRFKLFYRSPYRDALNHQLVHLGFWIDAELKKKSLAALGEAAPRFISAAEATGSDSSDSSDESSGIEDDSDFGDDDDAREDSPPPRFDQDARLGPRAVGYHRVQRLTDNQLRGLASRNRRGGAPQWLPDRRAREDADESD